MGFSKQADFDENITENNQLAYLQQEVEHKLQVQECKHFILKFLLLSTFLSWGRFSFLTISKNKCGHPHLLGLRLQVFKQMWPYSWKDNY